jgi:hypothetical protein
MLHTLEQPATSGDGFIVKVAGEDRAGHRGGRLYGTVVLPRSARLETVGGRGYEYFVDGTNYNEGVAEVAQRRRNAEPGTWRVEVRPSKQAADDVFLVVALPVLSDERPPHQIHRLEDRDRVGCEISGPIRTTRWWFSPQRNGVEVEIVVGTGSRTLDVTTTPTNR